MPARRPKWPAQQRLALAEYRLRLDMAYASAHVAFEDSAKPLVTNRTKTTITTKNGVEVSKVEVEEKIERGQRRDTRAVVEMGKLARGIWEVEAGGQRSEVRGRKSEKQDQAPLASPAEDPWPPGLVWPASADANAEDPEANESKKQLGVALAIQRLAVVRRGAETLEQAEGSNYWTAESQSCIYPSYEKNADGISFSVADWVRQYLPPSVCTDRSGSRSARCTTSPIGGVVRRRPGGVEPSACGLRSAVAGVGKEGSGFRVRGSGGGRSGRGSERESGRGMRSAGKRCKSVQHRVLSTQY